MKGSGSKWEELKRRGKKENGKNSKGEGRRRGGERTEGEGGRDKRRKEKTKGEGRKDKRRKEREGEGRRTDCALFAPVSLCNQLSNRRSLYQLLQGLLRTVTIAMELLFDGKERPTEVKRLMYVCSHIHK